VNTEFWSSAVQDAGGLYRTRRRRFCVEDASAWRKVLRLPHSGVICEVGCGPCGLLSRIAQTTAPPRRTIGVERDISFLNCGRRRLDAEGLTDVELLQGEANRLPLADHTVDAIVSYTLIEHLPEPSTFISECRRVVRSGGSICIATSGRGMLVESRLPEAPAQLGAEIAELERIAKPWLGSMRQALRIGVCRGPLGLPALVRSAGLQRVEVHSWSKTVALDDHRLSDAERDDLIRDETLVDPQHPLSEPVLRRLLDERSQPPPATPYLTEQQRQRLRDLYDQRGQLALDEARRPGSGPFFVTSVTLAASGIVA
jgi:SAM-dependent methyltransferase